MIGLKFFVSSGTVSEPTFGFAPSVFVIPIDALLLTFLFIFNGIV